MEEAAALASALRVIIMLLLVAAAAAAAGDGASVQRTIESDDDGDVIDCVDIYQQPALKHAPLGSRVIQAKPEITMEAMVAAATPLASKPQQLHQTWWENGSCPAGTIPIRRDSSRANPEIAELVRRSSPFGRPGSSRAGSYNQSAMAAPPGGKVEVAAAFATNAPYLGARARLPYWKVNVHPAGEFSMSYILIGNTLDTDYVAIKGADPPAHLTNQIAVGLVAWPSLFGDSLSRTFVYYTNDEGVANNCFNLDCGGFVHTGNDKHFALGGSFFPDSQVGGDLFTVTFGIHRDPAGNRWWVSVMDQEIGYYPESVFNTRFPDAAYVEMGGRVLDSRPGGKHTTTPMGSGMPACAGWGFAATIIQYLGVSSDGVLFNDDASKTIATTPRCYGVNPLGLDKSRGGFDIVYGGPGGIHCDK